jgi:hypothetical protein
VFVIALLSGLKVLVMVPVPVPLPVILLVVSVLPLELRQSAELEWVLMKDDEEENN